MSYWHAITKEKRHWLFPNWQNKRTAAVFEGEDARRAPFSGYFLRWEGDGEAPLMGWQRTNDGWFELWPEEPLVAWSMEEARARIQPLLDRLESGEEAGFIKKAYVPPTKPILVKEIEHPTRVAKAVVVQNSDGIYEAFYHVYAPNDTYLPVSTPSISHEPDWEWASPGFKATQRSVCAPWPIRLPPRKRSLSRR